MLYPKIIENLLSLADAPFTADGERLAELDKLANWISQKWVQNEPISLNFICTHNSRRSVFGQFWGAVIPIWLEIPHVETFSGGTEVTACHPNTVATLSRIGAIVSTENGLENPIHNIAIDADINPLTVWSKLYDDVINPTHDFAAIMTCSSADEGCPFVAGATVRVAIPFQDPKYADGTSEEVKAYDNCANEVGSTLIYVFSKAKSIVQ